MKRLPGEDREVDLGKIFGTRVRLHWSFLVLLAIVLFSGVFTGGSMAAGVQSALLLSAVFFCVLLHEFGHVFAARYFGIKTRDITLYPIGGVASLEGMPRKPYQEFIVAVAGPLVNVAIATVLVGVILLGSGNSFLLDSDGLSKLNETGIIPFLTTLTMINVALVVFNMIPAFPMDGGRVLRSILASFTNYQTATNIAATVGQVLAIGFGIFGVMNQNFMLALIGVFIFFVASKERKMARYTDPANNPELAKVMKPFYAITPNTPIASIPRELLAEQPDLPVVQEGRLLGILTGADVEEFRQMGADAPKAGTVMRKNIVVAELSETLEAVARKLMASDQQSLPVLKEHGLVGLILRRDLLQNAGSAMA